MRSIRGRLAPLVLAVAAGVSVVACRAAAPAAREQIVFSSNRSTSGGTHLWSISPSGDVSSLKQLTSGNQADGHPRVSPDGTLVAFARVKPAGSPSSSIWVRSLVTGTETRITHDESAGDIMPFWNPKGNLLGFIRGSLETRADAPLSRVWIVTLAISEAGIRAGRPAMLTDVPAASADWNPVTGADLLLMRQEPNGWAPFSIVRLPYPPAAPPVVLIPYDGRGNYTPVYSPDGLRFAFVRVTRARDIGGIYVAHADGSHEMRVDCEAGWANPAWSPDGTELVAVRTTAQGLWRLRVPDAGEPCAQGAQVTRGAFNDASPAWAVTLTPR